MKNFISQKMWERAFQVFHEWVFLFFQYSMSGGISGGSQKTFPAALLIW